MPAPSDSTMLCVLGAPAVGKMSVGHELAVRTGLRLLHNHMAIEPVLRFFEFGTPPFSRLVGGFRRQLLEEVAASDLPGLIFTYALAFEMPEDWAALQGYTQPFRERGARILYLELRASQEERLRRNTGEFRLAEKPSKRDLDWSRNHVMELDRDHRFASTGEFDGRDDYLIIDNTDLLPGVVAEQAIEHFHLARAVPEVADPAGLARRT